jgi:HD-GYP domain-containing protein (c-di-GMP phosphodiesterase class II)
MVAHLHHYRCSAIPCPDVKNAMKAIPVATAVARDARLIQRLVETEEPVYCVHQSRKKQRQISFRALYDNNHQFWNNPNSQWSFYLDKARFEEHLKQIREGAQVEEDHERSRRNFISSLSEADRLSEREMRGAEEGHRIGPNFGERYDTILDMDLPERNELIDEHRSYIDEILQLPGPEEKAAEALVDSTRDTAMINKSVLEKALQMGDEEAKRFTRSIVDSTKKLVKSSTNLIDATFIHDDLIRSLVKKSNGTVVQHMTRVYLHGVAFLLFYNHKVLKTSFANRARIDFRQNYRELYHRLLPQLLKEDVTLERVFHSGLQAVSETQLQNFATGFMIHDIGKARHIEYHEGEEDYDRELVVDHVRYGYTAVMKKMDYPPQAGLITGYHHEYYNHPSGYGFYRALLARHLKEHPKRRPGYCIAYTVETLAAFQALAYFPAKLLEIIDVYDALTDPNRIYKPPLEPEAAVKVMEQQFIREHIKLDPILFHLFLEYLEQEQLL